MKKEEFIQVFQQQYGGYICVDNVFIENFYNTFYQDFQNKGFNDDYILDYCKDYILSQGFAEEVVE